MHVRSQWCPGVLLVAVLGSVSLLAAFDLETRLLKSSSSSSARSWSSGTSSWTFWWCELVLVLQACLSFLLLLVLGGLLRVSRALDILMR